MISEGFFQSVTFGITAMVIVGCSWCLTGLVMGNAPKRGIPAAAVLRLCSIVSIVCGLIIMVITGAYPHVPKEVMILASTLYFTVGVLNAVMCDMMSLAMQQGPNGIVWGIIQSGTVGCFLTGILFFGVKATPLRIFGILLLVGALFCFGLSKEKTQQTQSESQPLVLFGHVCGWKLLSFLCFSSVVLQHSFITIPSYFESCRQISPIFRAVVLAVGGLIGIIGWGWYRRTPHPLAIPKEQLRKKWLWIYVLSMQSFSLLFAYTLQYPGLDILAKAGLGGMGYPTMVGSCIVAFTLTSIFILKEKIRSLQLLAVAGCVIGLICLCQQA